MSQEQPKENKQKQPKENKPFYYFHLQYEGSVEEFKKLLKKKIGFDFKDIGNNTIYLKIKGTDYETFILFMQGATQKGGAIKNYFEIQENVYAGALLSLDKILQG